MIFELIWHNQEMPQVSLQEVYMTHQEGSRPLLNVLAESSESFVLDAACDYGMSFAFKGEMLFKGHLMKEPLKLPSGKWSFHFIAHKGASKESLWNLVKTHQCAETLLEREGIDRKLKVFQEATTDQFYFDLKSLTISFSDFFTSPQSQVFLPSEVLDNSLSIQAKPLEMAVVDVWAEFWSKYYIEGEEDVSLKISESFKEGFLSTYHPESFQKAWPKVGAVIAGGYQVVKSKLKFLKTVETSLNQKIHYFKPKLVLSWSHKKQLVEQMRFSVEADFKKELGLTQKRKLLNFKFEDGVYLNETFFHSPKGQKLASYVKNVANTYQRSSLRRQTVRFCIPFERAKDLTLNHQVVLNDIVPESSRWSGKVPHLEWRLKASEQVVWVKAQTVPFGEAMVFEGIIPDKTYQRVERIEKAVVKDVEIVNDPGEKEVREGGEKEPTKIILHLRDQRKHKKEVVLYE
ncbi:MAG TPA: hypothetical protein VI959_01700 [Alphaproteobacteria bacterium]|nr:hypothetical protein [Alphaproteobacteria bacterium]